MERSECARLASSFERLEGRIKARLEDFEVEEVPAYEPSGQGPHVYLWVEKRDAAAKWTLRQLARFFGVARRDIGQAGLKDRRAVTRQWFSLPAHAIDEQALARMPGAVNENIEVLAVSRHQNKLRRGHLRGNRFRVVVRLDGERAAPEELSARVEAILGALERGGVPNYYGAQRFGREEGTLALGVALLQGDEEARARVRRDRFLKRLALNAVQSELFNRALSARIASGEAAVVWPGDVLARRDSGGLFVAGEDATLEEAQRRVDAREVAITGPMFGPRMKAPTARAAEFERDLLAEAGLDARSFEGFGKLCAGTRRPYLIEADELSWRLLPEEEALEVRFFLPSGSYATILLSELVRTE